MLRILLAAMLLLVAPAAAQQPGRTAPARPAMLGEFQAWTAATHVENGQRVCYAFTRARSIDGVAGRRAENVMLLVTHRRQGRDQVAVRAGYSFPRNATTTLVIGATEHPMFTAQETAFARDGAAAVAAMRAGREALSRGPGPNNRGTTADVFSLIGFSAAHDAISRECPPGRARR
jgi:hypothetical protein